MIEQKKNEYDTTSTIGEQKTRSMARDIVGSIVLVVITVSVLIGGVNYWLLKEKTDEMVIAKSIEYATYLSESLQLPIWNLDTESVLSICNAFIKNDLVDGLKVTSHDGKVFFEVPSSGEDKLDVRIAHVGRFVVTQFIGHDVDNVGRRGIRGGA